MAPARAVPAVPPNAGPRAAGANKSGGATVAPTQIARSEEAVPMVQFAAAASAQSARSFWQDLVHRFPDALGQREPVVIRFERDGMVFWRLRTEGFDTLSEAQTLCERMRAGGQVCFVTRS
jgi:hypothetical protein